MITLKQLVLENTFTEESDISIIKRYLIENDLEEYGMEISYELAKSKIKKMKNRETNIDTWLTSIPSKYLYANYSLDIASNLHNIELEYIAHKEIKSKYLMKWAKENISNIELPKVYFQPCYEYLKDLGICFKNG